MKKFLILSALSIASTATICKVFGEDIKYGIEAVTGFRSNYVQRGFEVAETTLDFQIETEVAINDDTFVNVGAWYATETGEGDFDEAAFFAHVRHEYSKQLAVGFSATYRNIDPSSDVFDPGFDDGVEAGFFSTWSFNKNLSATAGIYYDTAAEGLYANLEANYSRPISEKLFFSSKLGISAVDDYYGRNGLNDLYARLSLTYLVSDTVSITPFVGTSILLDDDDPGDSSTYAGLWFEVSF